MKRAKKFIIAGIAVLGLTTTLLVAQIPNSMFFMPGVPQSNRINPAIQPGCGFYLGFPALAPLRLQVSSSSLAYHDLIYYNSDIDMMITPMHPLGDKQALLEKLQPVNFLLSDFGTSLASFGFRAGKNFISIDLTTRLDGGFFFPKALLEIPINGLPDQSTTSLAGLEADVTVFNELSMGWSRQDVLIPNLDIGVRGKLLLGVANITANRFELELSTSQDEWLFDSDMEFNIATPVFLTILAGDSSLVPEIVMDDGYLRNTPVMEIVGDQFSQMGLGVDIGLNYRPIPSLLVSASLLDLGYIKWNNSFKGALDFQYGFNGMNVNPFTGIDTTFLQELQDSVMNAITMVGGDPYQSRLTPKLFVGASFYPIEKIGIGLLSRTDFLSENISQQFTATANMTTGRFINLSLSYTYMMSYMKNLGAGLSFNAGPFNLYVISDNIISGALWPTEARSVNLWFGMNLCFGYRVKAKAPPPPKDRPLIL